MNDNSNNFISYSCSINNPLFNSITISLGNDILSHTCNKCPNQKEGKEGKEGNEGNEDSVSKWLHYNEIQNELCKDETYKMFDLYFICKLLYIDII